jgi:hypothetical protein
MSMQYSPQPWQASPDGDASAWVVVAGGAAPLLVVLPQSSLLLVVQCPARC